MKLAIIGRTEILYDTAVLLAKEHDVKMIVTSAPRSEYLRKPEDFKELAEKIGADYIFTKNINSEKIIETIKKKNIDLGISVNWINIIKNRVISSFKNGILNAHCGDLPRYRGNACPNWAIINGEEKIVLSVHYMEGGKLDSGDVLGQEQMAIDDNTYIGDIYQWLRKTVPVLYSDVINKLQGNRDYILKKQDTTNAKPLRCYPRIPSDSLIDWRNTAQEIFRLIRASADPFEGAYTYFENSKMTIWRALPVYDSEEDWCGIPGQVSSIASSGGVEVLTGGQGKIRLMDISYKDRCHVAPAEVLKSTRTRLGIDHGFLIEKLLKNRGAT